MDELTKDGGPAFGHGDHENGGAPGMSLRDWFAGQALAGLCSNPEGPFQANSMSGWGLTNCDELQVSNQAYAMADAMLKAREE